MLLRILCLLLFAAFTAEPANSVVLYGGTGWRSPFQYLGWLLESLPVINQPALHLLLVALAPVVLVQGLTLRRRAWPVELAVLGSMGAIAVSFVWGMARGGSAYNAYFQVKSPVVGMLFALLLLSAVRTWRDLRLVWVTVLAAALVRATLAFYFHFVVARERGLDLPYATTHGDSLLWASGAAWLLAVALARRSRRVGLGSLVGILYLLGAMYVNDRRLAWIQLVLVLLCAYLLLPRGGLRRRVNRRLLMAAPLVVVYVVVGWGSSAPIFAPLEAIRTTGPSATDNSKLARNEENRNLVYTFRQSPLLGSGWGHEYRALTRVFSAGLRNKFSQYGYLPHNGLLALFAFCGVAGFLGMWTFVPVGAFFAARGYRRARRAADRAATMAGLCVLPAFGVQAFGDLGLNWLNSWLLAGVAITSGGRVAAWTGAWRSRARPAAPAAVPLPGPAAPLGSPARATTR